MNRQTVSLVAASLLVIPSLSYGGEEKISMTDAPSAVQAGVKKAVGDQKIEEFSKEVEDGKTTFEAEFEVGGVDHSVTVAEDGKVIEEETDVALDALPKAVTEAVMKAEPSGKMKEAAKVTADGKSCFEVDLMVGEVKHEIKVDEAGKVMSNKVEKEEDSKKEADEKGEDKD